VAVVKIQDPRQQESTKNQEPKFKIQQKIKNKILSFNLNILTLFDSCNLESWFLQTECNKKNL